MLWAPGGSFKKSAKVNRVCEVLLHETPALLADLVLRLLGRPPVALRLCYKMQRGMRSLEYFTTRQWRWTTDNTLQLAAELSQRDTDTFGFSLQGLDWDPFIEDYIKGPRAYVLKQSQDSIPACRRKVCLSNTARAGDNCVLLFQLFLLRCLDWILKLGLLYCLLRVLLSFVI